PGLSVQYTRGGETADDVIEKLINRCACPRHLVVISNDRRVQEAARRKGAASWTCDDFLRHWESSRDRSRPARPPMPDRLAPPSRAEVERWLAEFGDVADDPEFRELFERFGFETDERDD